MCGCTYGCVRPEDGVYCGVLVWQVPDEWMLAPDRTSRLLRRVSVGRVALPVGSRIDCCHTHTVHCNVTDADFKAFSAALGSSTTITTVELNCESD